MILKKSDTIKFINAINRLKNHKLKSQFIKDITWYNLREYKNKKVILYLTNDKKSGFGVTGDKELISLFSLVKGRGSSLVKRAIKGGARYLNCFEGHLTRLYSNNGFIEYKRAKNYSLGKPDVIFMQLKGRR